MEIGIEDRLLGYLKSSGVLIDVQHIVFEKELNYNSVTRMLFELEYRSAEQTKAVDFIYLDFAKAFDSVVNSQKRLLLSCPGIRC
jgi:hypothetical protein